MQLHGKQRDNRNKLHHHVWDIAREISQRRTRLNPQLILPSTKKNRSILTQTDSHEKVAP